MFLNFENYEVNSMCLLKIGMATSGPHSIPLCLFKSFIIPVQLKKLNELRFNFCFVFIFIFLNIYFSFYYIKINIFHKIKIL